MAIMGASSEKTERVLTALTQVMGKGKLQAEEYRGQIGEASPIAMQAFVKASGLTRAEFEKQMAAGKVLAEDILPKYADALQEMLGDTKPAATATRSFQRVKNAIFELSSSFGSKLSPEIAKILDGLADLLKESKPLVDFWGGETVKAIGAVIDTAGKLLKIYRSMPEVIAPGTKAVHLFTDEVKSIGGVTGVWAIMAKSVKMAGADVIDIFNDIKREIGYFVVGALDNLSIFFLAFEDVPGVGSLAKSMSDGLDAAADSVKGLTRESVALADSVVKGIREDASRSFDELMESTSTTSASMKKDLDSVGGAIGALDDKIIAAGRRLTESLMTPQEQANIKLNEARELYDKGAISLETLTRALVKYSVASKVAQPSSIGIDPIRLSKGFKETAAGMEKIGGATEKATDKFHKAAEAAFLIADAVAGIDEGLANAIGGAAGLLNSFQGLKDMQAAGAGKGQMAMAGAQMGGQFAGMAQGLGLFKGQRGQSAFGAQLSGDYSGIVGSIGGALGSIAGPVGAAVGAVLGSIIGGAIESGADEGLAQLRQVGQDVAVRITKSEGGLGGVVGDIGESIVDAISGIEAALGSEMILGGVGGIVGGLGLSGEGVNLAIKIRDEAIVVFVNGMRREFAETSDAVAFAVSELIRSSTFTGVSDFMADALRGLRVDDVADLEKSVQRLVEVDVALSGEAVTETSEAFRQMRIDAAEVRSVLQEVGAPMSAYIAWENKRIEAILEGVDAMRRSIIGVPDLAGPLQALNDEFLATGDMIEKTRQARQREADALLEEALAKESLAEISAEGSEGIREMGVGMGRLSDEIGKTAQTSAMAQREATQAREAYENFVASMDDIPGEIDADAIAEAINVGAAKGVQSITGAILGAVDAGMIEMNTEERMRLEADLFEMEKVIQAAQLAAAAVQIEAMLALGQVAGVTRDALEGLLESIPGWIGQVVDAEFKPGGARGGGGRRKAEREREQEQARQALEDFSDELYRINLNASSASGTLGDFAMRLRDIGAAAADALAAGGTPEDVARMQRLQFREARRDVLDPFTSFGRDSYREQSVDIEQMRRDALARAELVAQIQADTLGVPFERVFGAMEAEINAGAARMQRELTRGVIDAFGLPMEDARKEGRDFSKMMRDLDASYAAGEISGRRYRDIVGQIKAAQEQAIGGDVLAMLDKYYSEVEGREGFRRQMAQATFDIELAVLQIRFEKLKIEGALTEAAIERIGGFINFMDANPPDWDAFFGGLASPGAAAGGGYSGGSIGGALSGSGAITGLNTLLDSVRGFVRDFNRIDLGPFAQMADDFLGAVQGFQEDLDQELGAVIDGYTVRGRAQKIVNQVLGPAAVPLEELTREQLDFLSGIDLSIFPSFRSGMEDIFSVLGEIEDLEDLRPQAIQNILSAYRGVEESTSALVSDYEAIIDQFADVRDALEDMGASSGEFAAAQSAYFEKLDELAKRAVADVRGVAAEIRGGGFGGVSTEEQRRQAQERFDDLRQRAEEGDLEAVEQLGQAMRDLLAAEQVFTGGFGAEFDFIREQLAQFGEAFELNLDPGAAPMMTSDPGLLAKADLQIEAMLDTNRAIREGQQASEELSRQILDQLIALNERPVGGLPSEGVTL